MSREKTVNLVADVIVPAAVVLLTIALFIIFMPAEAGALFWTNMVYAAFLEVLLFAYIVWLPNRDSSVALKWVGGVFTMFYIVAALIWMLVFGLILSRWCHIKVYYAVIAVLTVLWILAGAMSAKVDTAHQESVATLSDNRRAADRINGNADLLLQQYRLKAAVHPELTAATPSVTTLCRGIATLSPAAMADQHVVRQVSGICSELEELISSPVTDGYAAKLKEFADGSIITLNYLKNSVRK